MSAPLHAILNDQDVSPIAHSRRSQPTSMQSSSEDPDSAPNQPTSPIPSEPSTNRLAARRPFPSVSISAPAASAILKRRRGSLSPDARRPTKLPATSSPYKRLRLRPSPPAPPSQAKTPATAAAPRPAVFNIFPALLKHPEITLEFTKHLPVNELISLYAMSQPFHALVNKRFTTLINGQALTKAPESARVFIFRCYSDLCHHDPVGRENEARGRAGTVRWVPTFRWLKMILFREMVVDEILALMAAEGHNFPAGTSLTIKKIWFTLDISDNYRRVGIMHNRRFWTDADLYLATEFIIKLDMRLTHPVTGTGDTGLRKMLLGQRSLSMLWKVLRREEMKTQLDMLRMIVRWNYEPVRRFNNMSIMGVPPHEVGALQWEGWGAAGQHQKFMQIDQLVLREGIRRRLGLQECWLDMLLDGFVDKEEWVDFRVDKEVVVETVAKEDEEEGEGEWETESESKGESESEDGPEEDDGPEELGRGREDATRLSPGPPDWAMLSPHSQHSGGARTLPYPSSEEEEEEEREWMDSENGYGEEEEEEDEEAMDEIT